MIIVSKYENTFLFHEIFLIFLHFQSINSNYAGKFLHRFIFFKFYSDTFSLSRFIQFSNISTNLSFSVSILKIIHSQVHKLPWNLLRKVTLVYFCEYVFIFSLKFDAFYRKSMKSRITVDLKDNFVTILRIAI